jgi:serine/threonine protein kinase
MDDHKNLALIDFGICRISTNNENEVIKLNSSYMAPEVFTSGFCKEADWWSLGIIM